ncbi:MAG TPA: hypothetical protein VNV61_14085 [Steroidobacteraceae bacterium]|jgi:hypothetical protein|nr:hypothetical protein [Steroidobacteraceae bacterium]
MQLRLMRLRLMRLRLIALTALFTGCTTIAVSDTDPPIRALIHQCFATVKESILFSGKCQPMGTWTYCDTVMSLEPHPDPRWKFPQFPPTLQAYRDDPDYWSGRIHEEEKRRQGSQIQADRVLIYGGLPIGTPLEIVEISRWFNGENGTFWIAYAVIRDGDFNGHRILLPWEGSGDIPWLTFAPGVLPSRADPAVNPKALTSCRNDAKVPATTASQ